MADPQVLTTLTRKAREIQAYIGDLERKLEQARRDLSHVLAAAKLFGTPEVSRPVSVYMNLSKMFPRYEMPRVAKQALTEHPEGLDTRGIAAYLIQTKGLDAGDRHLRTAVTYKLVQVMRRWERERKVERIGKRGTAVIWRIKAWDSSA